MVREARFSWDDADGREPPLNRDRIDDFDDELLDPDPPRNARRLPKNAEKPRRRKKRRRPSAENDRRHLAGADWLGEVPRQGHDGSE